MQDPKGQYVSKSVQVDNGGNGTRPTRPKFDAKTRKLSSLFGALGPYDGSANLLAPDEPPIDGGGGGGYVPNYSHFSSTELVQPWDMAPVGSNFVPTVTNAAAGGYLDTATPHVASATNSFYSTENPNGYLYDLKIVKGPNSNIPPFHDNPYYHNIPIDLNEGAGGSYIYVSFTRDPSHVEYNTYDGCGVGGNERPYVAGNYVDLPITGVDTQVNCCGGLGDRCRDYFAPLYCASDFYVNYYMRVPDLNDGAGGSYIYAFQSRYTSRRPIEVGVVTGNNVYIQPPAG